MRFLTLKLAAGAPGYGIFIPRRDHFISAPLPELLIKSRGTFWVGEGGGEVFVSSWESAPTFQDRCPAGPQPDLLSAAQREQLPVYQTNVSMLD